MSLTMSAVATLIMLAWLAQPAAAQDAIPAETSSSARATDGSEANVDRLPVDLRRLQRRLSDSAERDARGGPKIRFDINVYASAPRIQLVTPQDNVRTGQPRWSAPSHQEMMNLVTPQPFRHMPGISLGSVIKWFEGENKSR
jgi:hypothetical protein